MSATLQPGAGEIRAAAYLPSTPDTVLWGRLPCATDAPVLRIAAGTEVTIDTVSHEGILEDQGKDPLAYFTGHGVAPDAVLEDAVEIAATLSRDPAVDGPHVVTGPIFVEGAEPGDLLRDHGLETLVPRVPYGVISNRHGKGALAGRAAARPDETSACSPRSRSATGRVGLLPVVEGGERVSSSRSRRSSAPWASRSPATSARTRCRPARTAATSTSTCSQEGTHAVPAGAGAGRARLRRRPALRAGRRRGRAHRAGGVAAGDAAVRRDARASRRSPSSARSTGPLVRTPEYLVPTGLDPDLNEAMRKCVRAALALICRRAGACDEHLAYAYLSAATDFDISQVVDIVCGVHARIRESDFAGATRRRGSDRG